MTRNQSRIGIPRDADAPQREYAPDSPDCPVQCYHPAMKRSKPTGKDPTFRGRLLSLAELDLIRQQVEGFDTIDVSDDEMRALIEQRWPDLASKLPPRKTS